MGNCMAADDMGSTIDEEDGEGPQRPVERHSGQHRHSGQEVTVICGKKEVTL